MKKWMMIPALAGVVAIGGVAVATNAEQSLAAEQKGLLTIEEIETIAVKSAGGKVVGIELDRERLGDVYEVEVQSDGIEYDLDIDAKTGEVLRTDKDDMDDDDQDDNVVPTDVKFITQKAATEIAMKQAKGTVSKIVLDNDDGRVIYEIEIKDDTYEYDFDIDAISGEVLEFEKDRDDD
ncbi:PepSY domain-containing protein [Filibacter tadaridae]|uniref:Peptidase propeptide and YPEB domain protein n=1 Tax=Filibacter tadaridae TaxID=2483811 RepID=A0A3P5X2A8_9BACL|nr:PepSY domain-containing protein [Filibacter tadaridae]VDC22377.1 Peptidase propeptide and YPEB domain protein [Filibacter tadaridae]